MTPTTDPVVVRLRAALDELTTGIDATTDDGALGAPLRSADAADVADTPVVPIRRSAPAGGGRASRALGAAAAIAVVGAGAVVWTATRDTGGGVDAPPVASSPPTPTNVPDPLADDVPYRLTLPGLATAVATETIDPTTLAPMYAWIGGDGLLVLTDFLDAGAAAESSFALTDDVAIERPDGRVWVARSVGMAPERRDELVARIQPGSGLRFVLDDPAMRLFATTDVAEPTTFTRITYVGEGDTQQAVLAAAGIREVLTTLVQGDVVAEISVADSIGYRTTLPDGSVVVAWTHAPDRWITLTIRPNLAPRADAVIRAVERVPTGTATPITSPAGQSTGAVSPAEGTVPPMTTIVLGSSPDATVDTAAPAFDPGAAVEPTVTTIVLPADGQRGAIGISLAGLTPGRYRVGGRVIDQTSTGPVLAIEVNESSPPQVGAGVPLTAWSWADVAVAEEIGGVRVSRTVAVTGTWDGTTFRVEAVEDPPPSAESGGRGGDPTPGCDLDQLARTSEAVRAALGDIHATVLSLVSDGACQVRVSVVVDDDRARAALAPFGNEIVVGFSFERVG